MESNSRLGNALVTVRDWLNEQEWFQQLKAKWDELDPQSRFYLKVAGMGGSALLVLFVLLSAMWNVHTLKRDYRDKMELLTLLDNANDELRSLRDVLPPEFAAGGSGAAGEEKVDWHNYFATAGTNAGLDAGAIEIGPEKNGLPMDQAKETMYDLKIKHVTIRQVARYAFFLESGGKPVKLRNLTIDTKSDLSGYLDASLAVSGFTVVASGGK